MQHPQQLMADSCQLLPVVHRHLHLFASAERRSNRRLDLNHAGEGGSGRLSAYQAFGFLYGNFFATVRPTEFRSASGELNMPPAFSMLCCQIMRPSMPS